MENDKKQNKKKETVVISDKDHPSLCEINGTIRLRVLEDFNIEQDLPKWVRFKERWADVKKELGIYSEENEEAIRTRVAGIKDLTDEQREQKVAEIKALVAMDRAVRDDRWRIRERHEREVRESVLKNAKYVKSLGFWDRVIGFSRGKKPVPVEIAMSDLLEHLELTSTPELSARLAKLADVEASMRAAGQYQKADKVKSYRSILSEEAVVIAAGFTSYVTEDTMVDFLKKSERGVSVDFLRYYEDEIPQEAIDKKIAADRLMVFDNYVVAHYCDLIRRAAQEEKKASADEERQARTKRRDPILFGLIKSSRKLYYICDWKTDTDDLTLEKLEKELGVTRGSLVAGTVSGYSGAFMAGTPQSETGQRALERQIQRIVDERIMDYDAPAMNGSTYSPLGPGRISYTY